MSVRGAGAEVGSQDPVRMGTPKMMPAAAWRPHACMAAPVAAGCPAEGPCLAAARHLPPVPAAGWTAASGTSRGTRRAASRASSTSPSAPSRCRCRPRPLLLDGARLLLLLLLLHGCVAVSLLRS